MSFRLLCFLYLFFIYFILVGFSLHSAKGLECALASSKVGPQFLQSDWILPRGTQDGKGEGKEGKGMLGTFLLGSYQFAKRRVRVRVRGFILFVQFFFSNFSSLTTIMRSKVFAAILVWNDFSLGAPAPTLCERRMVPCILSDLSLVVGKEEYLSFRRLGASRPPSSRRSW